MIGRHSLAGAIATFAGLAFASGASAAPVYIGLQETGVNGGAVTQETTGNGAASLTNFDYGNSTNGFFQLSVTAEGTPPLPEPDLNSTSVTATATHPGTISIYVTELNQFPPPDIAFQSLFQAGLSFSPGVTVTESTYFDECLPAGGACGSSYIFDTATLLSTTTFTSAGSVTALSSHGLPITSNPIEVTEVFSLAFTNQNTSVSAAIDLSAVPEPASLALLGAGIAGLSFVRRRKRA